MRPRHSIPPEIENRIRGCIFGHAIGDALGFGAEGWAKPDIANRYEGGLRDFGQIQASGMRALLKPGMWTDDTSQMLCILESLVEKRALDAKDVARKFTRWLVDDGFGCGQLVYSVLTDPEYLLHPQETALHVWEESGRTRAPNGAVMRTSVLGTWQHEELDAVAANAKRVCTHTHADPRCIASCVAVSVAIAALLNGDSREQAIEVAARAAAPEEPSSTEHLLGVQKRTLDELDLDHGCTPGERDIIGYTYGPLGAAFWALGNAQSFEEALIAVINEGGDADTNAAVAGGLLGTHFGFQSIPERWVESLAESRYLHSEVDDLLEAMG